jgi:probable HAF family extracellular repeat protein
VNLYLPGDVAPHPFLYHNGFVSLDAVLPNSPGQNFAWLQGINDQGQIVGSTLNLQPSQPSIGGNTAKFSAFVYSNGQVIQLPTLGAGDYNMAYAINNNGDAVGFSNSSVFSFANPQPSTWHAVLYPNNGGIVDLGTAGGNSSEAYFINASGQVAGRAIFPPASGNTNYTRAFLYDQGAMSLLPTPGVSSDVTGLNDNGELVGVYQNASDNANHPFYYRNGSITDLNLMVQGLPSDMVVGTPSSINSSGQILAYAQQAGVSSQILLTPIPVPAQ